MANPNAYENASTDTKTRVNAVLVRLFYENQDNFVQRFRANMDLIDPNDHGKAFQTLLEGMRDVLAEDENLPKLENRGLTITFPSANYGTLMKEIQRQMIAPNNRFIAANVPYFINEAKRSLPELPNQINGESYPWTGNQLMAWGMAMTDYKVGDRKHEAEAVQPPATLQKIQSASSRGK